MRVAVTGSTGFTGRYVAAALAERGAECIPLDVELTDPLAVADAVAGTPFDSVIHLAAKAFVDSADWAGFYSVNQIGTFHLLEAIARHRPSARCVLASSAQVYGRSAEGLVREDQPTQPANHYALSKLTMEQGAAFWRDALQITIARPFNYTGVGQGLDYLIPKIVDHFRRRAEVVELGNLWVRRDFGDVRSVAAIYAALALADQPPELVNIATGILHSVEDILAILGDIAGYRIEVKVNPRFVRANDVPVLGGDITKLRAAVAGFTPPALRDTLTWMYEARA